MTRPPQRPRSSAPWCMPSAIGAELRRRRDPGSPAPIAPPHRARTRGQRGCARNRIRAEKRRQGFWLFGLIILLAALAGGTGWYFGAGPGRQVDHSRTRGHDSRRRPTTTLDGLGLEVEPDERHDQLSHGARRCRRRHRPRRRAARSPRAARCTLLVSTGPKLLAFTIVAGHDRARRHPEDRRRGLHLRRQTSRPSSSTTRSARDVVIAALGPTARRLAGRDPVRREAADHPGRLASGRSRMSRARASTTRRRFSRATSSRPPPGKQDYSDTIPKGMVIGIEAPTDSNGNPVAIHPGDTVNLTVSRGPAAGAGPRRRRSDLGRRQASSDRRRLRRSRFKNQLADIGTRSVADGRPRLDPQGRTPRSTRASTVTRVSLDRH